jgi:hypothetical protein
MKGRCSALEAVRGSGPCSPDVRFPRMVRSRRLVVIRIRSKLTGCSHLTSARTSPKRSFHFVIPFALHWCMYK